MSLLMMVPVVLAFSPAALRTTAPSLRANRVDLLASSVEAPVETIPEAVAAVPSPPAPSPTQELLAEGMGTALLTLLGTGTVASAVYAGAHTGIWQIAATWGGAVALAAYCTASVSGAHLNPALTMALVVFKGFPIGKALRYMLAQLAGAIVGAAGVLACFAPLIKSFEVTKALVRGTPAAIASAPGCMFFSLSPGGLSALGACAVEGLQMAILTFGILALTDADSAAPPSAACALIGLMVAVLISVFGPLTCGGFNPARDLGPRLVAALAGWGMPVFKGAWVYAVGPFVGALCGAAAHKALYDK